MNHCLVISLRRTNAFIALAIIVLPGFAGLVEGGPMGAVIGFLAGGLIATLVNGVLAVLLEIESHLSEINERKRQV